MFRRLFRAIHCSDFSGTFFFYYLISFLYLFRHPYYEHHWFPLGSFTSLQRGALLLFLRIP